jgi:outer membrane receptor for ferrienterochelin and colicin
VASFKLAGYLQDNWQVGDKLILNMGGRMDYFDMNKNLSWSPRLSLSYRLPPGSMLRAAWGIYYQSPTYKQLKSSVPAKNNTKPQRAAIILPGLNKDSMKSSR